VVTQTAQKYIQVVKLQENMLNSNTVGFHFFPCSSLTYSMPKFLLKV